MTFLFYEANGTYAIPTNNISDILAAVQPEDIIDVLDGVGVRVNRYFDNITPLVDYVLWLDQRTNEVTMTASNKEGYCEPVEEFKISASEIQALIEFFE